LDIVFNLISFDLKFNMKQFILSFVLAFASNLILSQEIISISPNQSEAGNSLEVTITGANTHFLQATNTTVVFYFHSGSSTATHPTSIEITSDESITANIDIPSDVYEGSYGYRVHNSIDGCLLSLNSFNVSGQVPPQLMSLSPNVFNSGQTAIITASTTNTLLSNHSDLNAMFFFSQASPTVTYANSVVAIDNETASIEVSIPSNTYEGDYDMLLYSNSDDFYVWANGMVHINGEEAPVITNITPDNAYAGETLNVSITGTNTNFTNGTVNVNFFSSSSTTCYIENRDLSNDQPLYDDVNYSTLILPNFITIIDDENILVNVTFPQELEPGMIQFDIYNSEKGYIINTFDFLLKSTLGIPQKASNTIHFDLYPNPFNDDINIRITGDKTEHLKINFLTIDGKRIVEKSEQIHHGTNHLKFNLPLSSGIYIVQLISEDGNVSNKKIIKE
jgi:hypothetical protein